MRRLLPIFVGFALYMAYGIFLGQYDIRIIQTTLTPKNPPGWYDYKGVVNVHSIESTGSGSIPDIIQSAQDSELDFLVLTDLNQVQLPDQWEAYHNDLLLMIDGEYSYLNSRLLNLFSDRQSVEGGLGQLQAVLADHLSQPERTPEHGLYVLAHPAKPKYRWSGELPVGLNGIEIINLKALWQDAWLKNKVSFLWSLLIYPFNGRLAMLRLFQEPREELALWDTLAQKSVTIGLAGADAEARVRINDELSIKFPSYSTLFGLVRNHVLLRSELTGTADSDRAKIAAAFRAGQFYMSLDSLADPKGFISYATGAEGQKFLMGSRVPWSGGIQIHVHLPEKPKVPFDIMIFRNGVRFATANSQSSQFRIHEPGVYRVLVRVIPTFPLPDGKKWVPWIYTNPFYIGQTQRP